MAATLDLDAHYTVAGTDGVAWRVLGYVERVGPDTEWDGHRVTDTDWVRAVMVGDSTIHAIEASQLAPIAPTDFCRDCGQVGCTSTVAE